MNKLFRSIALVVGVLCAVTVHAQGKVNIFVASGPTSGVYYPLGGGLADVLTKFVPNLNATAGTTDGSMANLLLIGQGKDFAARKASLLRYVQSLTAKHLRSDAA